MQKKKERRKKEGNVFDERKGKKEKRKRYWRKTPRLSSSVDISPIFLDLFQPNRTRRQRSIRKGEEDEKLKENEFIWFPEFFRVVSLILFCLLLASLTDGEKNEHYTARRGEGRVLKQAHAASRLLAHHPTSDVMCLTSKHICVYPVW